MSDKKSRPMQKSKYKKKDSAYKTPEFNDHKTLFSSVKTDENGEAIEGEHELANYKLSKEAQVDKFLTTWIKKTRPFKKYEGFRKVVDMYGIDDVYMQIKIKYRTLVLNEGWSEEKFEHVLEKVLDAKQVLSNHAFTRFAFSYDNNGRSMVSNKSSGTTSTIYDSEKKQAKIADVLDAWAALEEQEEED